MTGIAQPSSIKMAQSCTLIKVVYLNEDSCAGGLFFYKFVAVEQLQLIPSGYMCTYIHKASLNKYKISNVSLSINLYVQKAVAWPSEILTFYLLTFLPHEDSNLYAIHILIYMNL